MADAAELLTGVNSHLWVVLFGGVIGVATIRLRYGQIATVLKWLALALLVYVAAAFHVRPHVGRGAHATFVPSLPSSRNAMADAGRHPRHDHQPLPLLLAGRRRKSRRRRRGPADARRPPRRHAARAANAEARRRGRHVLLERRDVLHHPHDGAHACTATGSRSRDVEGRRGRARAARGDASPRCSTRSASSAPVAWPYRRSPAPPRTRSPRRSTGTRASTSTTSAGAGLLRRRDLSHSSSAS